MRIPTTKVTKLFFCASSDEVWFSVSHEAVSRPLYPRALSYPKPLAIAEMLLKWFQKDKTQYRKMGVQAIWLMLFFLLWLQRYRKKPLLLCSPWSKGVRNTGRVPSSTLAHDLCLSELQAWRSPFTAVTDYWRVKTKPVAVPEQKSSPAARHLSAQSYCIS